MIPTVVGIFYVRANIRIFDAVETMSRDTYVEIDGSMPEVCRSMVTVMNRLMFRQLSELKHRQLMGIVTRKTEMNRMRRPADGCRRVQLFLHIWRKRRRLCGLSTYLAVRL